MISSRGCGGTTLLLICGCGVYDLRFTGAIGVFQFSRTTLEKPWSGLLAQYGFKVGVHTATAPMNVARLIEIEKYSAYSTYYLLQIGDEDDKNNGADLRNATHSQLYAQPNSLDV